MGIETDRHLELTSALGPDKLLIRHFVGTEGLGRCFEYTLTLYSLDHDIKMESLLGTHATVRVRTASTERFFDGVVFEFAHVGNHLRYATYQMTLRPWLWVLAQNSDCRIFQGQKSFEIAKQLFNEFGLGPIKERLTHTDRYKPRKFCVQYRESHLNFISRLLESDGIYYYFTHEKQKHTLVLADDSMSSHDAAPGFEELSYNRLEDDKGEPRTFFDWAATKRVQPGIYTLLDYDFKKPSADLSADRLERKEHKYADGEWFDYPGHYKVVPDGKTIARIRGEERMSSYEVSEGSTDAVGLYPGCAVKLADHPRKDQNREYLVIGMSYTADSGSFETDESGGRLIYEARVKAIPRSVAFRPTRVTPAPFIAGVQTATVVGAEGQEICTDKYGRVKVQFHWDRRGKRNQDSSVFIRVAQVWAGARWGAIFIPRVGQEVVVEFLEGNPDKPLIIGSVYNESNQVPYALTEQETKSGFKTHSTKGGSRDDYNELRFEDKKGEEELHIQAQKDFTSKTKHDSTHEIQNKLSVTVDDAEYDTLVKKGKMTTKVPMNTFEVDSGKKIHLHVGKNEIIIDQTGITLTDGIAEIKLMGGAVMVKGMPIKLN